MKRIAILLLILLGLAPGLLEAQKPATQKRGTSAPATVNLGELEAINPFTGALTLRIPLGISYPLGRDSAYRFLAVHNANLWEFNPVVCSNNGSYELPEPDPDYNGGHAWQIYPFGRLLFAGSHWRYTTEDGSQHGLYPRLHHNYPAAADPNTFYSTSGTYLRLRSFPAGDPQCHDAGPCNLLDLKSGETREYHPRTVKGQTVWLPTRITVAGGNWIDIAYPADGSWRITDVHGRTHELDFAGPAGDYERVTELRVAAVGGGTATYGFEYQTTTFERQTFNPALCNSESPTVQLEALTRIVLPDNSYYEATYYTSDAHPGDVLSGAASSLRLPTGGQLRWTYTPLVIGRQVLDPAPGPEPQIKPIHRAFGVATRETALTVGGPAEGTWTYSYEADPGLNVPGEDGVPCHRTVTVSSPLGHDQVSYFTVSAAHMWSFGLPFTRCGEGVYNASGPFLSTETYLGSKDSGVLLRSTFVEYESDGLFAGGTSQEHNQRLVFEKTVFHDDPDANDEPTWISRRLTDHDGFGNFRTVEVDGTLNAQDAKTITKNFNPGSGSLIVDPELGTSTGSTLVMPTPSQPWLLETYDMVTVTAAGETTTTEHCFDETGFQTLERLRVAAGRGSTDVLRVFTPTTDGFIASAKTYGGIGQAGISLGALCTLALPAEPEYQTNYTYHGGVIESSTAINPCDGTELAALTDRTIDTNTGLVVSARDPAGSETVLVYDELGRLTSERPADDAWRQTEYRWPTVANPNLAPRITESACGNGSASCTKNASLAWSRTEHDGLGRLTDEIQQIPTAGGDSDQVRVTTYDAAGNRASVSSWDSSATTTFAGYDPFGRPGTITAPDGAVTRLTYRGERFVTRRTRVMTAAGVQEFSYATETRDAHGRLVAVCEGSDVDFDGSSCGGVETTYSFDVGDRLTRICQNRVGQTCGQIRRFVYDHRGALLQERHPEVGVNNLRLAEDETIVDPDGLTEVETTADIGNDWTFYTRNSRGLPLTRDLQGSTSFDLIYEYDAAGRPLRVLETNDGNPRPLKELVYADANQGANLRAGKLIQAKRHNYVDVQGPIAAANPGALDAVITELFRYEGPGGRLSESQTRFNFGTLTLAFETSQTYGELGQVATITYPQCRHAQGGCPDSAPGRTVSYSYTKGFPTAVPGYANQLTYQAGASLHQITHANGVVETYAIDAANGLARPRRITTTAGWDSGNYNYDGSGNITQIGSQRYRYDLHHRMVSGEVLVGGTLRTQTASYDDYGSISGITTNGILFSTPTDPTSNRLNAPLATYDGAGNMTAFDSAGERYEYVYDATSKLKQLRSNTDLSRIFLYNAADQRIASFDCTLELCTSNPAIETWTLRDPSGRLLRTWEHPPGEGWKWKEDYVYAGARLIATANPQGTFAIHLDHTGSVRQITNSAGAQVALHSYYPFGAEATNPTQSELSVKFTGHEQDLNTGRGELHYMRARYCSPQLGRFTTPDPMVVTEATSDPQRYNRYAYAGNNPIVFIDPTGKAAETAWDAVAVTASALSLADNLAKGNKLAATIDAVGLIFDVAAAVTPGVPAVVGPAIRVGRGATKKAAQLTINKAAGEAFEALALKAVKLPKNTATTKSFTKAVRNRIPDGIDEAFNIIFEAKAGRISTRAKKQISDFVQHAKNEGMTVALGITENTRIPKFIQELVDAGDLTLVDLTRIAE